MWCSLDRLGHWHQCAFPKLFCLPFNLSILLTKLNIHLQSQRSLYYVPTFTIQLKYQLYEEVCSLMFTPRPWNPSVIALLTTDLLAIPSHHSHLLSVVYFWPTELYGTQAQRSEVIFPRSTWLRGGKVEILNLVWLPLFLPCTYFMSWLNAGLDLWTSIYRRITV